MATLLLAKGREMEKYMCYGALGVAAVMFLLFLLDLLVKFPFGGGAEGGNPFLVVDIFGLIAAAIVAYLGWNAARDLK